MLWTFMLWHEVYGGDFFRFFVTPIPNASKNWKIVFQSGFNISPATHRIPISTHINPPLSLSLWKTEKIGHWVFKPHLFKKNSFPLNCPSTLVENKLIINLKFLFASWTFYSIYLYFCFLKSIPSLITVVW